MIEVCQWCKMSFEYHPDPYDSSKVCEECIDKHNDEFVEFMASKEVIEC